jgi:hypothetical protein
VLARSRNENVPYVRTDIGDIYLSPRFWKSFSPEDQVLDKLKQRSGLEAKFDYFFTQCQDIFCERSSNHQATFLSWFDKSTTHGTASQNN